MDLSYRNGRKEDCATLAEFVRIAAGGIIEFLYDELIPGMTPVEIECKVLENIEMPRSYENALVAEKEGRLVGAALSIPASHHRITEEMKADVF